MSKKSADQELAHAFDPDDPVARLKLVKDLVAMANSGGGRILFGPHEAGVSGVDPAFAGQTAPARIADWAGRFIRPSSLELVQSKDELDNGNFNITLDVSSAQYPIVIARDGTWPGFTEAEDTPLFREGDIWVRRNGATVRATREDLKAWIDAARRAEREKIMARLAAYVNLPEGSDLQVVAPSGSPTGSPLRLIENARHRRKRDANRLLSHEDLLWIFRQRDSLKLSGEDLEILIASSLRRNATLYWWLAQDKTKKELVLAELFSVFEASDRDKSDAAASILELAGLYATDGELFSILENLRDSRYKHFREAASQWQGGEHELADLRQRICTAKHDGRRLIDHAVSELEHLATYVAAELAERRSAALSRKLGDITRAVWAKTTEVGQGLVNETGAIQLGLPGAE